MSESLLIFDAVSGTESHTVLNITPSLSFALRYLRLHDRDRVIWIDQTCVNQNDPHERGRQVRHMNFVYKKAPKVTVWLGSGDPDSHRYMGMLSIISDLIRRGLYPSMEKPTHEQEATLFEALTLESTFCNDPAFADTSTHDEKRQSLALLCKAFCRNSWFERVWIVQEAVLAEHLVLQYGQTTVEWHIHAKACLELLWADFIPSSQLSGSGIGLTDTIEMLKTVGYGSSSRRLIVLLNALKCQKTSDPRDRVYGLMGISELPESNNGNKSMIVDYQIEADQLSEQLTLYCLETEQTLDVLSICCTGDSVGPSKRASWSINLASDQLYCDKLFSTELRTLDIFSTGMSRPIQYQYMSSTRVLSLAGVEIDTIQQVSKNAHSSEEYGNPRSDTWLEWKAIALEEQDADPYGDEVGRQEAFWRTLITNQIWDDPRSEYVNAPESVGIEFERWSKREDLKSTSEARNVAQNPDEPFYYFIANLMVGNQAHLFRTQRGYIGLACEHIKAGDKVVVFWGSHLPSILRETKSGPEQKLSDTDGPNPGKEMILTYRLIGGQIYVQGLMDGEAANGVKKAREFYII
jgi:hypothetical protein